LRAGHIVSVEPIPGLPADETIARARTLYAEKLRAKFDYDSFEVWDLGRMIFQFPRQIEDNQFGECQ
jgi:hypothetical protein